MAQVRVISVVMLVVLLSIIGMGTAFWAHSVVTSKSEAEKQADFVNRHSSLEVEERRESEFFKWYDSLEAERQSEFLKRYNSLEPERNSEFAEWYNSNKAERQAEFAEWYNSLEAERQAEEKKRVEEIRSKVLGSARPVSVDFAFTTTLKQLFLDTGVDKRINEKRAEEQLAPLTVDEIYNDFREEGISEIPQLIKDVIEIFVDDTVKVTLSSLLQSGTISQGWFLGKNFVGLLPYAYVEICSGTQEGKAADAFTATFTMYADKGSEDARKKEVLFDGTARQLCFNESGYPKFYEDQGLLVFKRPVTKLMPVPAENSIVLGSAGELEEGSKLYYPRITEEGIKVEIGFFKRAIKLYGAEIIEFRGELNPEIDAGAPVYYESADENSRVKLVGFVTQSRNISAVSAEFVLTGVEEVELADAND